MHDVRQRTIKDKDTLISNIARLCWKYFPKPKGIIYYKFQWSKYWHCEIVIHLLFTRYQPTSVMKDVCQCFVYSIFFITFRDFICSWDDLHLAACLFFLGVSRNTLSSTASWLPRRETYRCAGRGSGVQALSCMLRLNRLQCVTPPQLCDAIVTVSGVGAGKFHV